MVWRLVRPSVVTPLLVASCVWAITAQEQLEPELVNTQTEDGQPPRLTAEEAVKKFHVPQGFQVGVFAAEPLVRQPIAMTFDQRGRLWVAENYTYAEQKTNYDMRFRDRIVILEDADGDGQANRRTVFWDQGYKLTSIAVDHHGVWALCAPHLLFLADRNHDDVPDGPPAVMLDGWNDGPVRHNIVNGLKWGPDGWLYGRHGIQATSFVGPPGTSPDQRVPINCGIWRYHPPTGRFEVVCHGTTNPWGMDWNEEGELLFSNTVIGHLWHVVPGAHFERMYGEDLMPNLYTLIGQTADHVHWNTAEVWSDVRKGVSRQTDAAGGGHAHCGLLFYQADNWPEFYRGKALMINLHGRRINQDRLEPAGSTYVARHEPDVLYVDDPWFRGVELIQGPDGAVWIADWSDVGECHENDGVHRTSGRIYRVWYGSLPKIDVPDMDSMSAEALAKLLEHPNVWFSRQVLAQLRKRRAEGQPLAEITELLEKQFSQATTTPQRLRVLWALFASGFADWSWYRKLTDHHDACVRVWAWKLLLDEVEPQQLVGLCHERIKHEMHPRVLAVMISLLRQVRNNEKFWQLAHGFAQRHDMSQDKYYTPLLWYAVGPHVAEQPSQAVDWLSDCRVPGVRRWTARRLAEEWDLQAPYLDRMARTMAEVTDGPWVEDVLWGWSDGVAGRAKLRPPASWKAVVDKWGDCDYGRVAHLVQELSAVFGDGRAAAELVKLVRQPNAEMSIRRQAIRTLVAIREPSVVPALESLLDDRDLAIDAIRGLAALGDENWLERVIAKYRRLGPALQTEVLASLVVRPSYARRLVEAVEKDKIPRDHVTMLHLRQMRQLHDKQLQERLDQLWPVESEKAHREEIIARYTALLTPDVLRQADMNKGREVFRRACASCHKLFGEGGTVGPELTGAQRNNVRYLLENIVDPSAQVAENYRASTVILNDGRVLQGIILSRTASTLSLQTATEKMTVLLSDVEEIIPSALSLMPDQLLNSLGNEDILSLFAYLMAPMPPVQRNATGGEQ